MKPLKFPVVSTLALFVVAGLLAFYMPLPNMPLPYSGASSDVTSKSFR